MNKNSKTGGIVGGLVILIIGIGILWYNEGRAVKTARAISEAKKTYTQVKSDKVDPKYDGKLIATNGKVDLSASDELVDETFGIKAKSIKLKRTVEMYQWEESCETDDKDKEKCTYEKKWSDDLIDSSDFKEEGHKNPDSMPYSEETYLASNVKLGAFTLTKELEERLPADKEVNTQQLTEQFNNKVEGMKISGKYINNIPEEGTPEIGSIRVSFAYNGTDSASVLAVQNDDTFAEYTAKSGKHVYRIKEGIHTGAVILQDMTDENNFIKWLLRIVGTILIMGGIGSLFGPIQTLANFVPILRNIVSFATGLIAFVLGLAISLLVIAIAWFRFRPILSIVLIAIAIGLIVFLRLRKPEEAKTESK